MKKSIIIISVIILAYLGLWFVIVNQNQGQTDEPADGPMPLEEGGLDVVDTDRLPDFKEVKLDLSDKGLSYVPGYVFSRTDLTELNLSGNRLTGALPAEIRNLKNLILLDISNNQMTGIPAEIGQLEQLEYLDLSNNEFTGLPLELGNLSNLILVDLSGNDYSEYDFGIIMEKWEGVRVITKEDAME